MTRSAAAVRNRMPKELKNGKESSGSLKAELFYQLKICLSIAQFCIPSKS